MRKRLIRGVLAAVSAAVMIVTAAGCGSGKAAADTETAAVSAEPAQTEEFVIVDYDEPLIETRSGKFRCLYEADGLAWDNVFSIPAINVDLPGAAELNARMLSDFEDDLGTHFAMLEDLSGESVREGEPFVSVTYDYRISVDMLAIIIYTQRCYPNADGTVDAGDDYRVYYYDALTDAETDMFDYVSCHGISENGIAEALGGEVDVHDVRYVVCEDGGETYSVYYETGDGTMGVETVDVPTEHLLDELTESLTGGDTNG